MQKQKIGFALFSVILGVIGLIFSFVPIINNLAFITGVIGLVFAIVALLTHNAKGLTIAGLVTSILACGITLALQASWSNSLDKAADEINQTLDDATGDNTDDLLGTAVDVQIGTFSAESDEYGLVSSSLPVTVTNLLDESASFTIEVEAINPDGSRIATDYVYANNLSGGQAMSEDLFTFISSDELETYQNATYQVLEVTKF